MKRSHVFALVTAGSLLLGTACELSPDSPVGADGGGVDGGGPGGAGGSTGMTNDAGTGPNAPAGSTPLTPVRRTSFRRITNFPRGPEAKFITAAKISSDGSTVVFGTVAGTYTIAADGTGMTELSREANQGHVDISADGKKVVFYDNWRTGFVVGRDGSGRVKLPGVFAAKAVRMTAAGDRIFVTAPEAGGILKLGADGGSMTVVKTTEEVAKLNGVDPNGNHWRDSLDISDDGGRVVFAFLWDAFSMTGEGGSLIQRTQFLMPENRALKRVRVSGNGQKIAWNVEDGEKTTVNIMDFDGGNPVVYRGYSYTSGEWLHLSGNGSKAALGYGLRVLDTGKVAPFDATDSGSNSVPLGKPVMPTLTTDARRACIVIEGPESTDQGRPHQIVVVDFDPVGASLGPTIEGPATNLRLLPTDGAKRATVFARILDPAITEVNTVALRDGLRLGATPWMHWALGDGGSQGDVLAKDTTFSTNAVAISTADKVAPGPFTLRFVAVNQGNHVTMVDTEGLEAQVP